MKNTIETIEEFVNNIQARGPGSGREVMDIVGDIVPLDVVDEWRMTMTETTMSQVSDKRYLQSKVDEMKEMMAEKLEELDDDQQQFLVQELVTASVMAEVLDRITVAAFAAGLFTGLAAEDDKGFLAPEKFGNGWGNQ